MVGVSCEIVEYHRSLTRGVPAIDPEIIPRRHRLSSRTSLQQLTDCWFPLGRQSTLHVGSDKLTVRSKWQCRVKETRLYMDDPKVLQSRRGM